MRRQAGLLWVTATLLALSCASKDDDSSTLDASSSGFGDTPCGLCVRAVCTSQASACGAEPDCAGWMSCVFACGSAPGGDVDPTCQTACTLPSSSAGLAAQQAFTSCHGGSALETCDACGQASCEACRATHCSSEVAACPSGSACLAFGACFGGCKPTTEPCAEACVSQDPVAAQQWFAENACRMAQCSRQCLDEKLCAAEHCQQAFQTCFASVDCRLAEICFGECGGSLSCQDACLAKRPPFAQAAANALNSCAAAQCI